MLQYIKSLASVAVAAFVTGVSLGSGVVIGSWAAGKLLNHDTTVVTLEKK